MDNELNNRVSVRLGVDQRKDVSGETPQRRATASFVVVLCLHRLFHVQDASGLLLIAVSLLIKNFFFSPTDFLFLLQFFEAHCLREVLCC